MVSEYKVKVSIVIVCMNNLNNLFPCLNSIKSNTSISSETWVVAYLFNKKNLGILKKQYPWVKIIESNEIRGFSENNNLALQRANGEFCFVLNDDTKFETPVIDGLVESITQTSDASIMSPKTLFSDGRLQSCGRPKLTFWTYIGAKFKLWSEQKSNSIYVNQKGIFQTYNIVGAAFLIKTNIFKELGFFDETYFFCPEDVALSTLANKKGYKCYVDETIELYHLEGGTTTFVTLATRPAGTLGNIIFYSEGSILKKIILVSVVTIESLMKIVYWGIKVIFNIQHSKINMRSYINVIWAIYSTYTPKEVFIRFYKK